MGASRAGGLFVRSVPSAPQGESLERLCFVDFEISESQWQGVRETVETIVVLV